MIPGELLKLFFPLVTFRGGGILSVAIDHL